MIKQNMKYFNGIFVFFDVLLMSVALFLAWFIRIESGLMEIEDYVLPFSDYYTPIVLIVPLYLVIYNFFNLYTPHRTRSIYDELINILKANLSGLIVFLGYLYVFRIVDYSRKVVILFLILNIALAFIERIIVRYILRRLRKTSRNLKHIVFVGNSDLAVEYYKRITVNKHWGYRLVGVFDDKVDDEIVYRGDKISYLGKIDTMENYLNGSGIDEIIITISLDEYSQLENIVEICEKQGVYTRIIPDYYKVIPAKPYIEEIDGLPVIAIRKIPLNDLVKKTFKRFIDLVASSCGLILLSPMFLLIILLIKVDSKGPVLFRQTRVGLNREEFTMYKFRSMKLTSVDKVDNGWTVKDDNRVTRLGKILRSTSLDEFPQLVNVLKGDMSLIGPRPERPQFVEQYKEEIPKYMVKHLVRPGMTGWAQIHGLRGDTSIRKRIEYDLYYIENWSLKLEVKIFVLTFIKGFINENAY